LSIDRFTSPRSVLGPTVTGAALSSRRQRPAVTVLPPVVAGVLGAGTLAALAAYVPDTVPRAPTPNDDLPPDLRSALLNGVAARTVERVAGNIGVEVEEVWRWPSGAAVPVAYTVPAGRSQGTLADAATGEPQTVLHACRTPHLVGRTDRCTYCATETCPVCTDAVQPCPVCDVPVCGRCRPTDRRCRACSSLSPVGAIVRLSRHAGRGSAAWQGRDELAKVVVTQSGSQWSVRRYGRETDTTTTVDGEQSAAIQQFVAAE
jgi:hypothetical protein